MKILQISSVPVDYLGGTEKVIRELSSELIKKHDVTILQTTLYESSRKESIQKKGRLKIITCKNDYFAGGLGYSKKFKAILRKIWMNYDVVHVHGYGRFTSDFALKFLKNKKPVVFTAHGFFHSKKNSFIKKVHLKTSGKLIKNSAICTALTGIEKEKYLGLGVKKEKIKIIPNGIDLEEFSVKQDNNFKKKYSNGKKILLYVGRISESKGLQYVLKALKNIDAKFLIVGRDAGYKKTIEKIISENRLNSKVEIIGDADNKSIPKFYSIADIFVLFSEWEGFGISVLEAMASGKPVIVSDRGALPIIVKNNQEGFVVPFKNVKLLRVKIKELLNNSSLSKKMGIQGLKKSKNYIWKKIVKKYEEAYEQIK